VICGLVAGGPAAVVAQVATNLDLLVERRGVYLDRQTLAAYSGSVVAMWNDSRVRERGTLLDGRWHGVHETYYYEGQLEVRETYRNGVLHGPFESFFRLGSPSDKGTYRDGLLEGPYESRWSRAMAASPRAHHGGMDGGEVAERGRYSAGVPCGDWYRFVPQDGGGLRAEDPITYAPCPTGTPPMR
jgi:hypothetical protein